MGIDTSNLIQFLKLYAAANGIKPDSVDFLHALGADAIRTFGALIDSTLERNKAQTIEAYAYAAAALAELPDTDAIVVKLCEKIRHEMPTMRDRSAVDDRSAIGNGSASFGAS